MTWKGTETVDGGSQIISEQQHQHLKEGEWSDLLYRQPSVAPVETFDFVEHQGTFTTDTHPHFYCLLF